MPQGRALCALECALIYACARTHADTALAGPHMRTHPPSMPSSSSKSRGQKRDATRSTQELYQRSVGCPSSTRVLPALQWVVLRTNVPASSALGAAAHLPCLPAAPHQQQRLPTPGPAQAHKAAPQPRAATAPAQRGPEQALEAAPQPQCSLLQVLSTCPRLGQRRPPKQHHSPSAATAPARGRRTRVQPQGQRTHLLSPAPASCSPPQYPKRTYP